MTTLGVIVLALAGVGLVLPAVGLWRILSGALSSKGRNERVRSGMSLLSTGIGLLMLGVVLQPWRGFLSQHYGLLGFSLMRSIETALGLHPAGP